MGWWKRKSAVVIQDLPVRPCVIEALEDRCLMSVSVPAHKVAKPAPKAPAVHAALKHAKTAKPAKIAKHARVVKVAATSKKAAKSTPAPAPAPVATPSGSVIPHNTVTLNIPSLVGQWTGTAIDNATLASTSISASFTREHDDRATHSFTGTIDASGLIGTSFLTTVTIGTDHTMMVLYQNGNTYLSLVGAIQSGGKYIIGRYAANLGDRWTTGVFTMRLPTT